MTIKYVQKQLEVAEDGIYGRKTHAALLAAHHNGKQINLSENFTLAELLFSETAAKIKLQNIPDLISVRNLISLVDNLLDPICELLGHKITVTSCFRSLQLNPLVGSNNATSVHPLGLACDFRCPAYGDTNKIIKNLPAMLKAKGIKFDQLIIENRTSPKSWIHVGLRNRRGQQRQHVMSLIQK